MAPFPVEAEDGFSVLIGDGEDAFVAVMFRLFAAQDLDFLLIRGVVIQPPQIGAGSVVRSGGHIGKGNQVPLPRNAYAAFAVFQRPGL